MSIKIGHRRQAPKPKNTAIRFVTNGKSGRWHLLDSDKPRRLSCWCGRGAWKWSWSDEWTRPGASSTEIERVHIDDLPLDRLCKECFPSLPKSTGQVGLGFDAEDDALALDDARRLVEGGSS